MEITLRQKDILDKIVGEYISSAQPVSSQLLEKKYGFSICPATIRIEMKKLTENGYLYQPHTSAGRAPTDKGYRFFVDNLLSENIVDTFNVGRIGKVLGQEKDIFKWASQMTKFLAEESSNFVVSWFIRKDLFMKEGWEGVLEEPEFESKNLVMDFVKLLENLEKEIRNWEVESGVKVYIGSENPFSKSQDFSAVISCCRFPKRNKGVLAILGPKRMAYDKNISLMNSLVKLLENF